jgi:hypothetical protein
MFARVPRWREYLDTRFAQIVRQMQLRDARDKDKFHRLCAEMERDTGKPLAMEFEKLRQYILEGEYEIVQSSVAFNLGYMFKTAFNVAEQLQHYGYEVLHAPRGGVFFTSDSPVFTIQPQPNRQASIGMGFGWAGVEVFFPLNKRACLRLSRGFPPANTETSEQSLSQINRVTMFSASCTKMRISASYRLFALHSESFSPVNAW